jgi:hypothetical protein
MEDTPHVNRNHSPDAARSPMKKALWWIVPLVVVVVAAGAYFTWLRPPAEQPGVQPPPRAEAPLPAPQAEPEPAIKHPIEDARPETKEPLAAAPLPSLDESDKAVEDELAGLVGRAPLEQFLVSSGFIRRVVATVDNLPRSKAPQKMWPVKPAVGRFVTTGEKDDAHLSPENYRRYDPVLRFMESVDTGELVALYVHLYPLLQQAYKELGYPNKHFNDRLVEVVDHLLATPDVKGPIKLRKPWVMYEFSDPALEARSAGQKTLIRIGPENAARVKAKLRDIRRQVTRQPLPQ